MKHDIPEELIRIAFLEGRVRTHGAYEKKLARRITAAKPSKAPADLLTRLEQALAPRSDALTIGAFLRSIRTEQSLKAQEIFSRLGFSRNIYRMLEQDRISPVKISVEGWRRFRQFFDLPAEAFAEMLRRTHQLVWFRPSFRTTLARYDQRKNRRVKASSLEMAATELYTRARLPLPPEEQVKITRLLEALSEQE